MTALTNVAPHLPKPGDIVEVRGAHWAVAEVFEQGLPRSSADDGAPELNHVVSLQSLAEDRMGEELNVIWELEVGHSVAPDQGLPETITSEGFDDPNRLAAFVDAVRWGAVTSANEGAFQAPFRSGANVEAYQLEPLRRALQAPRTNLLLADDVGLGKTIEAGLVVQELLLRHRARSVVIVCPPSLALKWQDEMREKFGLDFVIVNSDLMAEVRRSHGLNANPFRLFPRVIVSMAWLPGLRAQRLLRDVYSEVGKANSARTYAFDVLIVDEAHHVAPSSPTAVGGARGYAVDSQRTIAVRDMARVCEHRLFLSATPHNGHSESFTALLEMIDNRRFSRGATVDSTALKEVTVRRLKRDIKEKGFKARELKTITFAPSVDEQAAFEKLDSILEASARANGQKRSGDIVSMLLKKRFLSSPYAFGSTLAGYRDATTGTAQEWYDEDEYYAEVLGSDQSDEEEGASEHPEFHALRQSKATDPLVTATNDEIEQLASWGLGYQSKPDSRLKALVEWLNAICKPDGKNWTNERVVIFTEYADTLHWIVEVLRSRGYDPTRLATIEGSSPSEERELTRARFNADPSREPIRVLVATDAAGEGIDLQAHCHRLVNFDVPFNPSRLEQRIGRIDRYGQTQTPAIFQFLPDKTSGTYGADMEFMRRIAEKVATVADDLGSVNPVIDADIQNHFGRVKVATRAQILKDEGNAIINKALAGDQDLNRALTQLANTYDDQKVRMHLTPANARRVVDTALTLTNQPTLIEEGTQDDDVEVFRVPSLARSWDPAIKGLDTRLRPGIHRPITFDDAIPAGGFEDVVHIHLGHTLMQKASRILRSTLFSAESSVNRVTAVVVDGLEESCVAAISRLVLVGRGGLRLHEEVFVTGVRVKGQRLAEAKAEALLEQALDDSDLTLADKRIRARLADEWNADNGRLRSRLETEMRNRAARHQESVTADLEKRRDADIDRARAIFGNFRGNLQQSLADRRAKQEEIEGMLFDLDANQAAQYRLDIRSMENRLENLAAEEAREVQAIKDRYTDIRPFVSAAAVVFALTPADAQAGVLA
ncbi:DISARM system SNF2-like helicase DrmD [Cellulosimicrobium cellulans]|uniref:DISARM system SNF2-like helicase DrmD n=1 Tax=Cellulosimicrobium cellulans TaxID=1710 RepID=UPI0020974136|nr:DISARM system SNF2-like helicase DrmD [Cellulosimicrobium cellulans]MCO7271571.1 DISARM system SNF2-like helicase DrmD [Cellulosimicrobium cellulans]